MSSGLIKNAVNSKKILILVIIWTRFIGIIYDVLDPADGQLDADEIIRFISPENGNHIEMEVNNLVHQTDKDDDLRLSKEEVLANYRHFFASQATEWGKRILTHHDEL